MGKKFITIGTFDGVHLGHKFIFDILRKLAAKNNMTPLILTFDFAPKLLKNNDTKNKVLTLPDEKLSLLKQENIEVKKLDFASYIDLFAASVPINQALGRIGCLLAGCCYGKETTSSFSLVFPEKCCAPANVPLLPTQPIMAAGNFVIFAVLVTLWLKGYNKKKGLLTSLYLIMYSIGRFLIEFLRDDERGSVGALSTSQFISLFIFAAGAVLLYFVISRDKRATAAEKSDN